MGKIKRTKVISFILILTIIFNLVLNNGIEVNGYTLEKENIKNNGGDISKYYSVDLGNPYISEYSLNVNPKIVSRGDKVEVSLRLDESGYIDESNICTIVSIYYQKPLSKNIELISLNNENGDGEYRGTFEVENSTESGLWKVKCIQVYRYYQPDYSDIEYPGYPEYEEQSKYFYFYDKTYTGYVYENALRLDLNSLNFEVQGTNTDIEGPKLDKNSIKVEPKISTVGENINISFKVTDESRVSRVEGTYLSPIRKRQKEIEFIYNEENEIYEASIDIDDTFESGIWKINSIYLEDEHNNKSWYNYNLEDLEFEVYGTNPDVTPPVINLDSLSIDKKEVFPGESVNISLDASDDMSGIKEIIVKYEDYNNWSNITLKYDQSLNKYVGVYTVCEGGHWDGYSIICNPKGKKYVTEIEAVDNNDNKVYIKYGHSEYSKLKALEFNVLDLDEPSVMARTIDIENRNGSPDEQVEITMKGLVSDYLYPNESEKDVRIRYRNDNSFWEKEVEMRYDQSRKRYVGVFEVDDTTYEGLWYIESVSIDNKRVYNSRVSGYYDSVDLSCGDLYVYGTNPDHEPPQLESFNIDKVNGTSGDIISISVKAKDNIRLDRVNLWYRSGEKRELSVVSLYNNGYDDVYYGEVKINDKTALGLWELVEINLVDWKYNNLYVYDIDEKYNGYTERFDKIEVMDLSDGDYVILPKELKDFYISNKGEITRYIGECSELELPSKVGNLSINSIGDNTFKDNSQLNKVIIPKSIKSIGEKAFYNSTIVEVELSNDVNVIGNEAFNNCDKLEKIIIDYGDNSIKDIGINEWTSFVDNKFKSSNISSEDIVYGYVKNNDNIKLVKDDNTDMEAPIITLNGENRVEIEIGQQYLELGATAFDNKDGQVKVVIEGEVDANRAGEYIIKYIARDSSGNESEVYRSVVVYYSKEDINRDGVIDIKDVELISKYYNVMKDDERWVELYDLNSDGIIDIYDYIIISKRM